MPGENLLLLGRLLGGGRRADGSACYQEARIVRPVRVPPTSVIDSRLVLGVARVGRIDRMEQANLCNLLLSAPPDALSPLIE
jgi:hypothetical protein